MTESNEGGPAVGTSYHLLTVKAVQTETAEARSFVLVPKHNESALYRYTAGQFLSFRIPRDEGELGRSYSLSSAPNCDPDMTICVKRVAGGRASNWINDTLCVGARIEASVPAGRFILRSSGAPLLLIAGGSGITPCISLIKQALIKTSRKVKLVYANRDERSIIYREPLEKLRKQFITRFTCQHWIDADRGFMTVGDLCAAAARWETADCYICGPGPLMDMAEETLVDLFGENSRILTERFVSPNDPVPTDILPTGSPIEQVLVSKSQDSPQLLVKNFRLTLDGIDHSVPIASSETLLQAALRANIDAPNMCTEGHCGTCMAWLRSGDVSMVASHALSKRNLERGYVLACQARPSSSESIWLDFDF